MIKFTLSLADSGATRWCRDHARLTAGQSWIEPFSNPALEAPAATDGSSIFVACRERLLGGPLPPAGSTTGIVSLDGEGYRRFRHESLGWPLEFFSIEMHGDCVVDMVVGHWGTAPVYVHQDGDRVHGSWSLPDLDVERDDLDEEVAIRFLDRRSCYSSETLFRSVKRLTERSTAVLDRTGLHIRYPAPVHRHGARQLRPGADVVSAVKKILGASLDDRDLPAGATCVEVSGGIDSAVVASAAVDVVVPPVMSCGMLLGGRAEVQQRRRREELVGHLGLQDATIDALAHAPFNAMSSRVLREPFSAAEEPYLEALAAEVDSVRSRGGRIVLTGIGGDELMADPISTTPAQVRPSRGPAFLTPRARAILEALPSLEDASAPASLVPESTLLAAACRAPAMLRAGCWPISPLSTPELVRFCEWLPPIWRYRKRLLRAYLARRGLSADFLYPRTSSGELRPRHGPRDAQQRCAAPADARR